ncbi:uncharacterized protein si:dkey-192k22.2 [Puntigrus tetrazona]|uniref:uncharacterized protein si:dkey-192k22.2 n=1 Tax=Puntigrus tetrazona TaxID=1606681 RepID=UPI001C8941AF|nr:uncharacterized protein si:dkey-192k22.2 [Puntigrus tetrazona]
MTRSSAFKLGILFFLTFILCLPEFFPKISQIEFLCEPFDPCTPENDAQVCSPSDPPCATEMINASSQHTHSEGWYLCKTEMDLQLLHNTVPSQSEEHVMVQLVMKAGNLSGWNISEFAFLNNSDLYTGPQKRLFYCCLLPDNSKCPDLNISMQEKNTSSPTQDTAILKNTTSANPTAFSLKTSTLSFRATASTVELKCQTTSSSFLFYYQESNETARSAALPVTQKRKDGRWCVITSLWMALVLTVLVVTLLSVCNLIFKSRKRKSHLMPVSAHGHQPKVLSKQKENLMSDVPDVSIVMCSNDGYVFSGKSSVGNRTEEDLLKVADRTCKRNLPPIYEITETSQNEDEEDEQCNAMVTKEEFKKTHQLQHLGAQGHCEAQTYLHHRSNFSCIGHEEDGGL